ncbi:hypothetical protein BG006_006542 [Podila minutissima]|uniref:F-box domain-containing protein n=1 Tax=Podila minutissima TaxID=64525 RepID=A0A9P5SL27_9FUNG|nr:hypothetical protein BG006_006542 [Podila minutissima]
MTISPFHILHILDGITDCLLFNDLFSCVLVNREWHELINPILWKDVITFRSISKSRLYWFCHDYTLTAHCQQTLEKYAHHIRAVTCQGARSLRALRTVKCKDVTEINYVVRPENDTKNAGLDDLFDWIRIISPQLRAIFIEEITLTSYSLSGQLDDLLDLLDDFPHITNIYLGIDYIHNLLRHLCDYEKLLPEALIRHSAVLTILTFNFLPVEQLYAVVTGCPALQELRVNALRVVGSELAVSPDWICQGLQHLTIRLEHGDAVDKQDYDMQQMYERNALLKELCMDVHREEYPGTSPFVQRSLEPLRKLPQLAELQQLRQLIIAGVAHMIGQSEVELMVVHWPRLQSLELPILNEYDGSGMYALASVHTFDGRVPNYARWFPGLHGVIPTKCYTLSKDRHVTYDWEWRH